MEYLLCRCPVGALYMGLMIQLNFSSVNQKSLLFGPIYIFFSFPRVDSPAPPCVYKLSRTSQCHACSYSSMVRGPLPMHADELTVCPSLVCVLQLTGPGCNGKMQERFCF